MEELLNPESNSESGGSFFTCTDNVTRGVPDEKSRDVPNRKSPAGSVFTSVALLVLPAKLKETKVKVTCEAEHQFSTRLKQPHHVGQRCNSLKCLSRGWSKREGVFTGTTTITMRT